MAINSYFIKVVSLEYLEFSDDNATAISAFSVGIMGGSSFSVIPDVVAPWLITPSSTCR